MAAMKTLVKPKLWHRILGINQQEIVQYQDMYNTTLMLKIGEILVRLEELESK